MEPMKITNFELYDIVTNGDQEEINSLEELELEGWVKTNRDNGSIGFVEFNDGTYFSTKRKAAQSAALFHQTLTSSGRTICLSMPPSS